MFAQTILVKVAVMEIHGFILLLNISVISNSKSFANSKSMGLAQNTSFLSLFEQMLMENRYVIVKQNTNIQIKIQSLKNRAPGMVGANIATLMFSRSWALFL